jgi:hypothetical protein
VTRLAPRLWAPVVTVAIIASPLLFYARLALGEELSAAMILAVVVAVVLRAKLWVILLLVVLACIAKETNPPFIFALAAICTFARTNARELLRRRQLIVIVAGAVIGFVCNSAFNVLRFGTISNAVYTQASLRTTNPGVVVRLFAALGFSPNGGLVWFWPAAPLLVVTIAITAIRRGRLTWRSVAAPIVLLILLGQLAGLSTWFSPFGWFAWGPRLSLPFMPALIVAACVLGSGHATRFVARVLAGVWIVPTALVVVALGLPEAVVLFHGLAISQFFAPVAGKPCTTQSVAVNPGHYYQCLERTAWTKHPWMLQLAMRGLDSAGGWFVAVAFVGAVLSMLYLARLMAKAELGRVTVTDVAPEPVFSESASDS